MFVDFKEAQHLSPLVAVLSESALGMVLNFDHCVFTLSLGDLRRTMVQQA